MHGFFTWLAIILDLLLPAVLAIILFFNFRSRRKLKAERDILLLEKEAALGFVHNVGEVFADSETVDMDSLLTRVLHYAVRTCKASSGAIHLMNTNAARLEARAVSGVFPPPFEISAEQLRFDIPF